MSVEYRASTGTNMSFDNSKIAYKQMFGDANKLRLSVHALRNNPCKAAALLLGLLSVLLLAAVIGQSVHRQNLSRQHENTLKVANDEKAAVQRSLKAAQDEKKRVENDRNNFQKKYEYMSTLKVQMETNNNLLQEETRNLKQNAAQLESSKAALDKELEEMKKLKDEVESNSNALSTAKHLLQNQYDSLVQRRLQVHADYISVRRERDNLQNKFNNVSRAREQLQLLYNDLVQNVENLQARHNLSASERDQLADRHRNLTEQQVALEATCSLIRKAEEELRASYGALVTEKNGLEVSLKNATVELDRLRESNDNRTAQRDQLQDALDKLNATVRASAKRCSSGWRKFENSCYYPSAGKKGWSSARSYCQNKGADLVVINSREEMVFLNSMYSSGKEVWIGLTDEGVEGKWVWVDGSPLTLTFWGPNQPNSHNGKQQDCVEIWHQKTGIGEWNDESCTIEQNWLCEM
ncbi:low affinity immunoglobulin epsilon Fc receptor-like [Gouania willdenowi]|uniref:Low affinity immunoglobulin epsilon Fc receptor-like n=1 Tax=Gouania willdenowi TaxID=441366 RepID=A0A8C5D3X1_GOUWI|nr:low affinity immunoglobulin epsilon Fc receptor-like [Gouania willdenowi]